VTRRIDTGTSALDAFWAIQESAGRGVIVDGAREVGSVSDHHLRRAAIDGVDLVSVVVDELLDESRVATPADHRSRAAVTAVVMAGGKGERLQPLTFKVPKPLLTVGRTTVLERLLDGLFAANITDVWIAVNYMADAVEERIGDGDGRGLRIQYLREREYLDRAGALSLLPEAPPGPILLTNSDQITNLNFARMIDYHLAEEASITVASFTHEITVPYGVLRTDGNALVAWDEKPTLRWPCNAGFYVLEPRVLPLIPPDTPFSTTELLDAAMAEGMKVVVFPLLEKWIDIGTPDDLQEALLHFATGDDV
jgi:NDP-sugar pyrophosphorylase family protein